MTPAVSPSSPRNSPDQWPGECTDTSGHANSRVEQSQTDVDCGVANHVRHPHQYRETGDRRKVCRLDALISVVSDARPIEQGLEDDRSSQNEAHVETEDRKNRTDRVPDHVTEHHESFWKSLRPRCSHVVLLTCTHQFTPQHPAKCDRYGEAPGAGGNEEVKDRTPPGTEIPMEEVVYDRHACWAGGAAGRRCYPRARQPTQRA